MFDLDEMIGHVMLTLKVTYEKMSGRYYLEQGIHQNCWRLIISYGRSRKCTDISSFYIEYDEDVGEDKRKQKGLDYSSKWER